MKPRATADPMSAADLDSVEAYVRLAHVVAESAFDATDEEIEEEMLDAGEDLGENAERLRAVMLDAAERGRVFADLCDDGFRPGLRPRAHLAAGDLLATSAAEHEEIFACDDDPDEMAEHLEELRTDLVSQARQDTREPSPPAESVEPAAEPAAEPAVEPVRSDPRLPAEVRRSIERFEPRNPYQRQLRSLLIRMMLHIERDCPPPGVTPLDYSRDFHSWWRILHIYRWILLSPAMATRRARAVLDKLLKLDEHELTVYLLNRLGERPLTPEMRALVKF